jgi:hypothetical protein
MEKLSTVRTGLLWLGAWLLVVTTAACEADNVIHIPTPTGSGTGIGIGVPSDV